MCGSGGEATCVRVSGGHSLTMVKLTEDMVVARSRGSDMHNVKKLNCW